MCAVLHPKSHTTDIGPARARFLHAILSGEPIDLPAHICDLMIQASQITGGKAALPFGMLIMRLAGRYGIQHIPGDPTMDSKAAFTRKSWTSSLAHAALEEIPGAPADDDEDPTVADAAIPDTPASPAVQPSSSDVSPAFQPSTSATPPPVSANLASRLDQILTN